LSKPASRKKLDDFLFDDWVVREYRRTKGFTALIILISTANLGVLPLRSTFTHVIGDELDWHHFTLLMRGANVPWDGVLLMPITDEDGGRWRRKRRKRCASLRIASTKMHWW